MKEAAEFAETTQILMNVSEFTDVSKATDVLISAVQAFGYTAETSMDVVDLLNTIGNNYAISTADLAQSLTKSSASLVAAGGDLAEAAALTATANKIIQDADSVGTALKTTSLRLRGTDVKVLEEEGLDSEGAVTSKSKLQSKVKALSGVDILTATGEYKSTYEILLQIAEVWENISDMDQAALLELISGKRNSSVVAAILQSPKELEKAYKDAMNAEGSALKENEKYLDSIQGKIDQFNNAMQAMWSNTLDSDLVKKIVSFGTEIVKIIDKIGLLNSALIAIATISMIKNKMGPIAFFGAISDIIRSVPSKVGGFISSLMGMTAATSAYTAETLAASVANGALSASEAASIASKNGLALATTNLTAAEASEMLMKAGVAKADALAMVAKLGLTSSTKALSLADIQAAVSSGTLTTAQGAQIASALGLTVANKGLAASFMALWTALWPILAVMAAIAAIYGIVKLFDLMITTTSELREDLSELKSELSDIESQLESLNGELETTQERMTELLAKDSLTFTEQEELEALQKQNNELERAIYLLEQREKRLQKEAQKTFDEIMDRETKEKDLDGDGEDDVYDKSLKKNIEKYENALTAYEEAKQALVEAEKSGDEKEIKKAEEKVEKAEKKVEKWQGKVDEELNQYLEDAEGIDYSSADEKTKKYLDYIYNTEGRVNILSGDDQAKTVEIKRIFNKDDMSGASNEIDKLVEKLAKNHGDETIIAQIGEQCKVAEKDLKAVGLSVQDATDYFTKLGTNASFNTIEGKIAEVSKAATNFESLLKGNSFKVDGVDTGLADLFDEEGKIIQTKLSQVFQGTSDQTRAEITRLLEGSYDMIADGLDDAEINYLMNRMGLSFSRAILEIEKTNLSTKNLELFPGLEDEISGIIDTFSELTSAVGSVVDAMDTLDKARAEEAYSGSMSLETLEALMQSTDNYADLIEVDETGAIKLATNAQEILVAQKLEAIKQNAALALEEAELAYQEALHTEQTYSQTGPAQEFMRGLWNEVGGAMAFVGSLWSDLTSGNWDGAWDRAKAARESSITTKETEYSAKAAEASAAVAEAAKNVENAEKMNKIAQGLTPENVKERYSSEEASGGNETKEDAEKDLIEEGWEKLINKYENELALITNERDLIQAEIDRAEAQGGQASKEMYDDLIRSQLEEKKLLEDKKVALEAYLEEHKDSIDPETWTEYNNEINATAVAIKEATTNIYEFAQALRDIDMHYFEQATDEISRLAAEIDFVMSLFEDEDMSDEAGNWTEAGITKINLMRDQMTAYAGLAKMWGDRLAELQNMQKGANGLYAFDEDTKNAIAADFQSMFDSGKIDKATYDEYMKQLNEAWSAGGFSEEIYNEWVNEAEDGMRDAISSQKDVRDAMLDMYDAYIDKIEEGIEKEIEAYEDLIDAQKEELDAARELHDFRKQVANDSKDIQELERRIASLSGSTAASDVAERRKLQAQLRDKQGELDDRYYDHAHDARSNALDDESDAFAEAKNRYVENMREAAKDTEWVINEMITNGIFNADVANDFLLRIQDTYNIPLSTELTAPWAAAADRAEEFKNAVGIIAGEGIPPYVTMISDDIRNKLATDDENNPWNQAIAMAEKYADFLTSTEFSLDNKDMTTFEGQINSIISKWNSVKTAADAAYSAQNRTYNVGGNPNVGNEPDEPDLTDGNTDPPQSPTPTPTPTPNISKTPTEKVTRPASPTRPKFKKVGDFWSGVGHTGVSIGKKTYNKASEIVGDDGNTYYPYTNGNGYKGYIKKGEGYTVVGNSKMDIHTFKPIYQKYAKGTTGTARDQWALTDEPQFGDELVLVPGKDGNLSFMRKGTGVVPADMTQKLFELAQIPTSDLMNKNLTAIVPNITKNDFKNEFNFESLVHVDTVDSDTLPKLEKMVDKKIDDFSKALNYSLKRFAR